LEISLLRFKNNIKMETLKIQAKILTFQTTVDVIKKDAQNPHFKNTYASLPHILAEVKGILNALKCTLTQPIIGGEVLTIVTDTESGEALQSSLPLTPGLNAQQKGSEITYFRRYTLSSLLGLEIDEDDDGNAASKEQEPDLKEWLNKYTDKTKTKTTETWEKVVAAVKSKQYTVAHVEGKYKVSKELKAELQKL